MSVDDSLSVPVSGTLLWQQCLSCVDLSSLYSYNLEWKRHFFCTILKKRNVSLPLYSLTCFNCILRASKNLSFEPIVTTKRERAGINYSRSLCDSKVSMGSFDTNTALYFLSPITVSFLGVRKVAISGIIAIKVNKLCKFWQLTTGWKSVERCAICVFIIFLKTPFAQLVQKHMLNGFIQKYSNAVYVKPRR